MNPEIMECEWCSTGILDRTKSVEVSFVSIYDNLISNVFCSWGCVQEFVEDKKYEAEKAEESGPETCNCRDSDGCQICRAF